MTNDTQISDREIEILRLVATGSTNQQIADQLNISVNTVKVHLRNIFTKIGAVSRTEATVYAIRTGLVAVEDKLNGLPPSTSPSSSPPVALANAEADLPLPDIPLSPEPGPQLALPAPAGPDSSAPQKAKRPQAYLLWAGLGLVAALIIGALVWRGLAPAQTAPPTSSATAPVEQAVNDRWTEHTPLPHPRQAFALAAYDLEGRLYVIGGRKDEETLALLDRYDPKTDRWVSLADKPTPASAIQAVALRDKIYVPGGDLSDGNVASILEAYNPRDQRWETLSPLPAPRSRYGLVVWEGKMYLLGGWDGQQITNDLFVYDPERDAWSRGPALPMPRQYADASVVAGQIYLVGGEDASGPLRDSLRLDLSEEGGRWESITPMPQAVAHPHTATVINSLVVIDADSLSVWQYDVVADDWVASYPIPLEANDAAGVAFLSTSLFFVANDQASAPGALGEYQVIYAIFVPGTNSSPAAP